MQRRRVVTCGYVEWACMVMCGGDYCQCGIHVWNFKTPELY